MRFEQLGFILSKSTRYYLSAQNIYHVEQLLSHPNILTIIDNSHTEIKQEILTLREKLIEKIFRAVSYEIMLQPLEESEISQKAKAVLADRDIKTVVDLIEFNPAKLSAENNIIYAVIHEITQYRLQIIYEGVQQLQTDERLELIPPDKLSSTPEPSEKTGAEHQERKSLPQSIMDANLSRRARHLLWRAGKRTIDELIESNPKRLLSNIGSNATVAKEIAEYQAKLIAEKLRPSSNNTSTNISDQQPASDTPPTKELEYPHTGTEDCINADQPESASTNKTPLVVIADRLSKRTFNIVRRFGIGSVESLFRKKDEELRQLPGLGEDSLQEIITLREELGSSMHSPEPIANATKKADPSITLASVLIQFQVSDETKKFLAEKGIQTLDDLLALDSSALEAKTPTVTPLSQLEGLLTRRTYNSISRSGIKTVEQLLTMDDERLLTLRNFGMASLEELKGVLDNLGYSWNLISSPAHREITAIQQHFQTSYDEQERHETLKAIAEQAGISFPDYGEVGSTYHYLLSWESLLLQGYTWDIIEHFDEQLKAQADTELRPLPDNTLIRKERIRYLQSKGCPLGKIPTSRVVTETSHSILLASYQLPNILAVFIAQKNRFAHNSSLMYNIEFYAHWLGHEDNWQTEIEEMQPTPIVLYRLRKMTMQEILNILLGNLSDKHTQLFKMRFGLDGENPKTLQDVANTLNITRERVRQIIGRNIKDVGATFNMSLVLQGIIHLAKQHIDKNRVIREVQLIEKLNRNLPTCNSSDLQRLFRFLTDELVNEPIGTLYSDLIWISLKLPPRTAETVISNTIQYLAEGMAPMRLSDIQQHLGNILQLRNVTDQNFLIACFNAEPQIERVDDHYWGLVRWQKRIHDDMVMILRELGDPAHFTTIAELVNKRLSNDMQITAHNVHAQLGRYTNLFIRTDSGTFGLKEWNPDAPSQPTKYVDLIERVLEEADAPMTANAIFEEVNLLRNAKLSSIVLYVSTHERFIKYGDGLYGLAKWKKQPHTDETTSIINEKDNKLAGEITPFQPDEPRIAPQSTPIKRKPKTQPNLFELTGYNISDKEVATFLAATDSENLGQFAYLSAGKINALLMKAFQDVMLIGELPISPNAFQQLTEIVRKEFSSNGTPQLKKIPSALFVTTMVFSARYSDRNAHNFWTPYAQLVWGLDEASQYLQLQGREHFQQCRVYLSETFEHLGFHVITDGDVARPVFQHAIIPFYLQDSFAGWLLQHVQTILEVPAEDLPIVLQSDSSLRYVPTRLRLFISGEQTADTAADLIRQMAEAVDLFREGHQETDIAQMLVNPIERALWMTTAEGLWDQTAIQQMQRTPRPRLEWVWSLEDHAMQIRLINVTTDIRPDLCVWAEKDADDLLAVPVNEKLLPWGQADGNYLVDEVFLEGGPLNGEIVVLADDYDGDEAGILFRQPVPALPNGPVALFRITQQNAYGIPVDSDQPLAAGEWLVSMAEDITLIGADSEQIPIRQFYYTPDLLHKHSNHTQSGQYTLQPPVIIRQGQHEIARLMPKVGDSHTRATLIGDEPIPNLTPQVPPAFTSTEVTLVMPGGLSHLERVTLTLQSRGGLRKTVRLDKIAMIDDEEQLVASLHDILPNEPATYQLTLRRDLKPLLSAPLQFSVLPEITIIAPDSEQLYTPKQPPQALLDGINVDAVIVPSRAATIESDGEEVEVSWLDMQTPICHLALELNGQRIPLAWSVKRLFAWIDEPHDSAILTDETIGQATIHVRGMRNQAFWWVVGHHRREQHLNAQGRYDTQIGQDALLDLLRDSPSSRVELRLAVDGAEWTIGSYIRQPKITALKATYDPIKTHLSVQVNIKPQLSGQYTLHLHRKNSTPLTIGELTELEGTQVFEQKLEPGDYAVTISESGQTLHNTIGDVSLRVERQLEVSQKIDLSSSILDNEATLVYALKQPAHMFQEQKDSLWSPLARMLQIRDADDWVGKNGMLPGWTVTGYALRANTGNDRALSLEPEISSHKGTRGIGRTLLDLNGELVYAYVSWERALAGGLYNYQSHLRIFLPQDEFNGVYSQLDEYDLWPAYQCRTCGEIIGSRSGTKIRTSPSVELKHRHGNHTLKRHEIFHDIGNSYELHATITPAASEKCNGLTELIPIFANGTSDQNAPLHTAHGHGWALTQSMQSYTALDPWFPTLNTLHDWLKSRTHTPPMMAAATRMFDRLLERNDAPSYYMLLIALIARSEAHPQKPFTDEMRASLRLSDNEINQLIATAAQTMPHLLEWALMWVELFHVHAIA